MSLLDKILNLSSRGVAGAEEPPYFAPLREEDYVAAVPLLQQAVRRDDAQAMAMLATMYAFGRGVPRSLEDAADWFRQSAVRGFVRAQVSYGACLAGGVGVARNDIEAAYWLYRAALAGEGAAIDMLSDLVFRNQSVVGEHFTQAQFVALKRLAHRVPLEQQQYAH